MATRKFVIDTSIFVNPHARGKFGGNPTTAVQGFIKIIGSLDAEFFIPPSVFNELKNFAQPIAMEELELNVKKRAPNTYGIYLPAAVFYDFVEDVRNRINKGMRLAEEYAQDNSTNNNRKLKKLREKYRDAMRTGIIDSKEDFELVLLAKELDCPIVSSDEGVIKFAQQVGIETVQGSKFYNLLKLLQGKMPQASRTKKPSKKHKRRR